MTGVRRVLVTGWPSFVDGEATAGDVLAMQAVSQALGNAGVECDLAWSPVFRPSGLTLADAAPQRYSHLVFCCGPLHGAPVEQLHQRYPACERIAVGVSVTGPDDRAATGFRVILPRDGGHARPRRDLAAEVTATPVPVAGVVLAPRQPEYGRRGRHPEINDAITSWLASQDCAQVPLDTRLDTRGWPHHATPAQVEAVIRRLDVVVTTRLHGLVLALKNGVPALAIDPVAGGAKVAAQADAWDWPAIIVTDGELDPAELDQGFRWCLSQDAAKRASSAHLGTGATVSGGGPLTTDLLLELLGPRPATPPRRDGQP